MTISSRTRTSSRVDERNIFKLCFFVLCGSFMKILMND